jgi:hypothetical protein
MRGATVKSRGGLLEMRLVFVVRPPCLAYPLPSCLTCSYPLPALAHAAAAVAKSSNVESCVSEKAFRISSVEER